MVTGGTEREKNIMDLCRVTIIRQRGTPMTLERGEDMLEPCPGEGMGS